MNRSLISCLAAFLLFSGAYCAAEELQLGAELPSVEAKNQDGETVQLADYADKPYLLVFFYPKAHTGGCTQQACSLRDAYDELNDLDVTIIGVSADGTDAQHSFKEKYGFQYTLLADSDLSVAKAFGVPLIGKNANITARQAYLFKDGKLVWLDKKASTSKQADDVKKAIAELSS